MKFDCVDERQVFLDRSGRHKNVTLSSRFTLA